MLKVKDNKDTQYPCNIGIGYEFTDTDVIKIQAVFDTNWYADRGAFVVCEPNKARYKTIITNIGIFSINKDSELLADLI